MTPDLDTLIDNLAAEARPVRPQSSRLGRLVLSAVAAASTAGVYALYGFRHDVLRMQPSPILAIALGMILLLAIAAGSSAVRMARPQVGAAPSGAPWALAALLLLPASVMALIAAQPAFAAGLDPSEGIRCLAVGLAASASSLVFLAIWLKRGAPVSPERASWLAGLCAGAIGAFAVTLECPDNDLAHLAIWHVAVVIAVAGSARLALPPLLRW